MTLGSAFIIQYHAKTDQSEKLPDPGSCNIFSIMLKLNLLQGRTLTHQKV